MPTQDQKMQEQIRQEVKGWNPISLLFGRRGSHRVEGKLPETEWSDRHRAAADVKRRTRRWKRAHPGWHGAIPSDFE